MSGNGLPKISTLGSICCGCGACSAKCPKSCIVMKPRAGGFLYPEINARTCIGCGACDSVCPAIGYATCDPAISVYWAKSRDSEERNASSSGGMFALFAHDTLNAGGVVVGAGWNPDYKSVSHVLIEDERRLDVIMRSKYVQSDVDREVYDGVRNALLGGRRVLFVGTACQVGGMRAYLGKLAESKGFLAIDVVCHGVPSPALWEKWSDYKERTAQASLCNVNMRSKKTGWVSYSTEYVYAHSVEKSGASSIVTQSDSCVFKEDWYMRAFLANLCLRPSCHACPVKRSCGSDVTLGDFWGVQSAHPKVDREGGVSAVICNTEKGVSAFNALRLHVDWGESSFDSVLLGNPCMTKSAPICPDREQFMCDLEDGADIEAMMDKYPCEPGVWQKLRGKLSVIKRRAIDGLGIIRG